MIIAYGERDVQEYMAIITSHELENPVLIDKYMMGIEAEVDAICDGEDYLIPALWSISRGPASIPATRFRYIRPRISPNGSRIRSWTIRLVWQKN